ncbi:hypothetical protein ACIBG7_03555 [Nonomuraea sp. NPDC050328]|uniref:hypothetical protein n=1 Tax=Nonomuraea sp. NPDC050328 TaxID=3364361 RepID=UPI00379EAC15
MKWRLIGLAGVLVVALAAALGVRAYLAEPPALAPGLVRLTLSRYSGIPPIQHPYPGGAVSLNAVLSDDEVFIGLPNPGRELRVRKGQTIEIPGGSLTLVEIWNMWQRTNAAVDVRIVTSG